MSGRFTRFHEDRDYESKSIDICDDLLGSEESPLTQAISQDSIGYRLLQKQGWSSGKDLGRTEQGCLDPVPVLKDDIMGFGRWEMEVDYAEETTKKWRVLEIEKEDSAELQQKYKDLQEKEKALQESLSSLKANLFCDLCEKQYYTYQVFDNHLSSWDHAHKQLLNDLKKREFGCNIVSSKWRKDDEEREREAMRLQELAERRAQFAEISGSTEMGTGEKFIPGGFREVVDNKNLESENYEENTTNCEENSPYSPIHSDDVEEKDENLPNKSSDGTEQSLVGYESSDFDDTSNESDANEEVTCDEAESKEISKELSLEEAEALCDELEREIANELDLKEAEALCDKLEREIPNELNLKESSTGLNDDFDDLTYLYLNTVFFTPDDIDLPPLPDECGVRLPSNVEPTCLQYKKELNISVPEKTPNNTKVLSTKIEDTEENSMEEECILGFSLSKINESYCPQTVAILAKALTRKRQLAYSQSRQSLESASEMDVIMCQPSMSAKGEIYPNQLPETVSKKANFEFLTFIRTDVINGTTETKESSENAVAKKSETYVKKPCNKPGITDKSMFFEKGHKRKQFEEQHKSKYSDDRKRYSEERHRSTNSEEQHRSKYSEERDRHRYYRNRDRRRYLDEINQQSLRDFATFKRPDTRRPKEREQNYRSEHYSRERLSDRNKYKKSYELVLLIFVFYCFVRSYI